MESHIRNFVIISHVDHGKSTLADRFLELTNTISPRERREQYLDMMALEREKGITIKLQPVRMKYRLEIQNPSSLPKARLAYSGKSQNKAKIQNSNYQNEPEFILNLIDTPGHIDFSYEVSRGLAAVEGAILLVDATKGIQAQTLHHLNQAKKQGLVIIPAINKIDLPQAEVGLVEKEVKELAPEVPKIFEISAKLGTNVAELLAAVVERVPAPKGTAESPLRCLIFDSEYDRYQGVIAYVRVVDGQAKNGDKIFLIGKGVEAVVKQVGYFTPQLKPCEKLSAGEIGYIATGIKEPAQVRVGDTITNLKFKIKNEKLPQPLPGYHEPQPLVFTSIYPQDAADFGRLKRALAELNLQDPAFTFEVERKSALGQGMRSGFLGTLHAEIILERLKREYGLTLLISRPQVVYKFLSADGREQFIYSANDFPDNLGRGTIQEQWSLLEIICPVSHVGAVNQVLEGLEGRHLEQKLLGQDLIIIKYQTPLRELMTKNLYEQLKSATKGFASLSYELLDWREAELVKMEILIAGFIEEALSQIVPAKKMMAEGRNAVEALKEILPRQQFAVAIQAKVGGKIIARETLPSLRRDVTAPLYGGDYTRKRKLLEKQKRGKKELAAKAHKLRIPPPAFFKLMRQS